MIRAVILDLGGTLIDKYSLSPLINLRKSFSLHGANLSNELIFKDMGMGKKEHIKELSKETSFRDQFLKNHGRPHTENDLCNIYDEFCDIQYSYLQNNLDIIPETESAIRDLKEHNIKIGITTGFNKEQMDLCLNFLSNYGIYPDSAVSSSCIEGVIRPNPDMIYENMRRLGIDNPDEVLKVDDTCVGIQEGHNVGCISVGVARWSIYMGVTDQNEINKMNYEDYYGELEYGEYKTEFKQRLSNSRRILHTAKPCYLINTLSDLKNCLF